MQGQANMFVHYAKEKPPFAIQRYVGETERLYGVLDRRLEGRDFVAGAGQGRYSIADIAIFGWVNFGYMIVDLKQFPNVYQWAKRVGARPGVQKGLNVPGAPRMTIDGYEKKMEQDPEFRAKEEQTRELINKAKEQYGYVYKSP